MAWNSMRKSEALVRVTDKWELSKSIARLFGIDLPVSYKLFSMSCIFLTKSRCVIWLCPYRATVGVSRCRKAAQLATHNA